MAAGKYNLLIEERATLKRTFIWKDEDGRRVNLAGYSAKLQVRETKSSSTVLLELTSDTSAIELGGSAGTIVINMTPAETDGLYPTWQKGYYDLVLTAPDSTKIRLLQGIARVSIGVTEL